MWERRKPWLRPLFLVLAGAVALGTGCATTSPEPAEPAPTPEAGVVSDETAAQILAEEEPQDRSDVRVGWGIYLFDMQREPNRTTTRVLDLWILRLLEVGSGTNPDYSAFGLLEGPLFKIFARRKDGVTRELRFADFRILALYRGKRQSEDQSEWHVLKLPFIGSLLSREEIGNEHKWTFLYLVRVNIPQEE